MPPTEWTDIEVRALAVRDSLSHLTEMLHRAYAHLAAEGLNMTQAVQDEETTRQRTLEGQCLVATIGPRVVGTVTVSTPLDTLSSLRSQHVPLYREPDTGHMHQFAVDPELRHRGIGTLLMQEAERWARGRGYLAMGIDAPLPARELIQFFRHQGYQVDGELQWPGKNYRSVVMRKVIDRSPLQAHLLSTARHAHWALRRVLDALQAVSDEDYRRDLGLHLGSIHGTLNHLLVVEREIWWPRIVEGKGPTIGACTELETDRARLADALRGVRHNWVGVIEGWSNDRLLGEVQYTGQQGEAIVLPLASLVAHVFDHATLHHGELVSALIRLGHTPPEVGLATMLREEIASR